VGKQDTLITLSQISPYFLTIRDVTQVYNIAKRYSQQILGGGLRG
jgi:hypothetical protein